LFRPPADPTPDEEEEIKPLQSTVRQAAAWWPRSSPVSGVR